MPVPSHGDNDSSRQGASQLSRYAAVSSRLAHDEQLDDEVYQDEGRRRPEVSLHASRVASRDSGQGTSRLLPDQTQPLGADPILVQPSQSGCMLLVEPLRSSDLQPSYAQELTNASHTAYDHYGKALDKLGSILGFLGSIPGCFCFPKPYQTVAQGSVGLVSRFGRFYKAVDPGLIKINPMTDQLLRVDIKLRALEVKRRTMSTRDSAKIDVDCVLLWKITNPYKASFCVDDVQRSLAHLAHTHLRAAIGGRDLKDVISDRQLMAEEVEEMLGNTTHEWGIEVNSVLIKDFVFSENLEESLSYTSHQRNLCEARIMAAEAEVQSAELLRKAGDILSFPAAMHLRELEAYQEMAKNPSTKVVIFPTSSGEKKKIGSPSIEHGFPFCPEKRNR